MSMSVGGEGGEDAPMSDINTTPLVDVMLVLLIIFLITIPVAIKSVKVKTPNVVLTVRAESDNSCGVYWGLSRVNAQELQDLAVVKFKNEADRLGEKDKLDPNKFPEVHIRGDRNTPYRCIGGTVAIMQRSGFFRVGFISEPKLAG
jgi:biopolymer transport protein ExbD